MLIKNNQIVCKEKKLNTKYFHNFCVKTKFLMHIFKQYKILVKTLKWLQKNKENI